VKKLIVSLGLICLVILFAIATPAAAQGAPADTVRVVQNADSDKVCSAVVIAPDYALTARHCLSGGMAVDGLVVDHVRAPASVFYDIAVIYAPGLKCPCATLGGRPVHGTRVVAIGFPGRLEGERRATESARVNYIGAVITIAPWMVSPAAINGVYIFTDKAIVQNGDSGGGLFAIQNGVWVLVGITVIGVPVSSDNREVEQASGFAPVDIASKFLPHVRSQ
jgi:hypothetical protein